MLAPLLAFLAAAQPPTCPPNSPTSAFAPGGEQLRYRLDALGAEVGSFEIATEPAPAAERRRAALQVRSHAKTNAFVSTNVGQYQAFAVTLLGPDLSPVLYKEELDEGQVHKSTIVGFPPRDGHLPVEATLNGNPDPLQLDAGPTARDMLSTLFVLRAQALSKPVCLDVYAGRKVWRLAGKMAAREEIETPLGKFAALRFDGTATRLDDPSVQRNAHVWISDDARRLPLVALGDVKGKTIRAQLIEATGVSVPRRAARPQQPGRATPRVGAAIGRDR
jgi:hypothetical protein